MKGYLEVCFLGSNGQVIWAHVLFCSPVYLCFRVDCNYLQEIYSIFPSSRRFLILGEFWRVFFAA